MSFLTRAFRRIAASPHLKPLVVAAVAYGVWRFGYSRLQFSPYLAEFTILLSLVTLICLVVALRGRARDFATMLATTALGLAFFETYALAVSTDSRTTWPPGAQEMKAELGWGPARPGAVHSTKTAATGETLYDVDYTMDENLTRKTISAKEGPAVAFFGDSFTFGDGLPDKDTFPQAFADATDRKFRVLNLAYPGYGPHQFLRVLEIDQYHALLKDDLKLAVILTAPWHVYRSSCALRWPALGPGYAIENGRAVYRGQCYGWRPAFVRKLQEALHSSAAYQHFIGARQLPVERAEMDLYIAVLVRAGALIREKYGAPTLIVYLPEAVQFSGPGYDHEEIKRKLREGGLLVIDGGIDPKAYPGQDLTIPGEGHPTGLANRIRAQRVKAFLENDLRAKP